MNNFVFYSPTEFVFGKNTEVQVGALARKYGAQKVMIVYGGGSVVRSGLLDRGSNTCRKPVWLIAKWEVSSPIPLTVRCTKVFSFAVVSRWI